MKRLVKKVISYDIGELPITIMEFFESDLFKIIFLGLIYYGGMAIILYGISQMPYTLIWPIWLSSAGTNMVMLNILPGLFHFDNLDKPSTTFMLVGMGPLLYPRALCCLMSFAANANCSMMLLRRPIARWGGVDDPWVSAIVRNKDLGYIPSFGGRIESVLKAVSRIARFRIW